MMNSNPVLHYRWFWLLVGYTLLGLVIYLSVTSQPIELDLGFPYQDKFSHALAYFVLTGWFAQVYHVQWQLMVHAMLFIVLGILMEYVQSFDPVRMAEAADMLANITGVLAAVVLSRKTSFRLFLKRAERVLIKNEK